MRRMTRAVSGLLAVSLAAAAAPPAEDGGAVSLRQAKYAELAKTVRGLKGKVVIVDFWAEF